MNWPTWLISVLVAVVLQTTVWRIAPDVPLINIDLLFALSLLYGLLVPAADARLAALFTGLAADLTSAGPVGLYAFAFGVSGVLITYLRDVLNRHVWSGRLVITLLAALPAQCLILLHLRFVLGMQAGVSLLALFGSAVATALGTSLAVALVTLLPRLAPRRRFAGRASWSRH